MELIIQKDRKIELPEPMLKKLGLKVGDTIVVKDENDRLSIRPKQSVVDELRGAIKVADNDMIDETVSAEVWDLN
jgi:bifunctional DNA-binding transcriptional regulator/antitoxin component of YhaV-PrlF toxin-antitoxin module